METENKNNQSDYTGKGMLMGAAIGAAAGGLLLGKLAVGAALGLVLGGTIGKRRYKKLHEDAELQNETIIIDDPEIIE